MLDVRFSERRETYRAPVVPNEIKGLVTFRNQSEHHPFLMWDVSEQGLGLWVAASLKPGEEVRVTIAQPFLLVMDCEVRWCRRRQDAPGYHIGLKVLENYKRLRGLIDYVSKHSEPDAR